jgi:hypothetical protein
MNKKKYNVYLVGKTDTENGYEEVFRNYVGNTIAISKAKAENNIRYRLGNHSYSQLHLDTYADNCIDFYYEAICIGE